MSTDDDKKSLNAVYGHGTGFLQSMSLILNAALMVYAHVGLSAVFVSNQERISDAVASSSAPPVVTAMNATEAEDGFVLRGACVASDYERWITPSTTDGLTGADKRNVETNYCAQDQGCLIDAACISTCIVDNYNYTSNCAACFAAVPRCTFDDDFTCAVLTCGANSASPACWECTKPCVETFANCSGLPLEDITEPWLLENKTATYLATSNMTSDVVEEETTPMTLSSEALSGNTCEAQKEGVDIEEIDTYFEVYQVLFFDSMKTAWDNDARLLAVIVVIFSFVWPYTKNIILMFAWYLPLSEKTRFLVLRWLRRLGKFTLVDVYVILILIVGMQLELTVSGGVPVIARGEPRLAIIAFLVATLWEFVHIEWMSHNHQKLLDTAEASSRREEARESGLVNAMRFDSERGPLKCLTPGALKAFLLLLLVATLGLLGAGSTLELVKFTTVKEGEEGGCPRSYNLFTIGSAAVNELALEQNEAVPAVWTLYASYIAFVLVIPWFVHAVHVLAFALGVQSKPLFQLADMLWTFACVEVFLIGLFVVEFKFENLVASIAGDEGAALFGVESELGLGFYVLIGYCACGGSLHYFFNSSVAEFYQTEPHHKIDRIWTALLGSCLEPAQEREKAKEEGKPPPAFDAHSVEEAAA